VWGERGVEEGWTAVEQGEEALYEGVVFACFCNRMLVFFPFCLWRCDWNVILTLTP